MYRECNRLTFGCAEQWYANTPAGYKARELHLQQRTDRTGAITDTTDRPSTGATQPVDSYKHRHYRVNATTDVWRAYLKASLND